MLLHHKIMMYRFSLPSRKNTYSKIKNNFFTYVEYDFFEIVSEERRKNMMSLRPKKFYNYIFFIIIKVQFNKF